MIVDTSVWIDWLGQREKPEVLALQQALTAGVRVALLPVIFQELLQGARSPRHFRKLDGMFSNLPMERVPDPQVAARLAAELYARCRWSPDAKTVRSNADCLIAASCVLLQIPLLHNDRDFLWIQAMEPRLMFVPFDVPPP